MRSTTWLCKQQDDRKKNASQSEVKTLFENSCLRQQDDSISRNPMFFPTETGFRFVSLKAGYRFLHT